MDTERICPSCQKPLAKDVPLGLCPECLIKSGFPSGAESADAKQPPFIPPAVEELAKLFPQLEILELIGKGGMGAVYKARQPRLNRFVALKILPPSIGSEPAFTVRFAREAQALAQLNHPGIVTLYEFGEAGGLHFFMMEFVDGVNLRQLLINGRIAPREALAIVPQICDALQFAHDQGIVHRDIKPENILLDRRGRVKVADFGLAKIIGGENETIHNTSISGATTLTEAGKIIGTPQYMSPEQIAHPADVDHRADIYALGVVFYQMLTGELPGKKIEAPSRKVHIDVRLDEVVLRALESNPELRFQQVGEVKTCVETIAQTENSKSQIPKSNIEPRFSRTAIASAVCATIALVSSILALVIHVKTKAAAPEISRLLEGATASQILSSTVIRSWSGLIHLNRYIVTPLAFIGIFGAIIFGWLAIMQIRRSRSDPILLRAIDYWLALMDNGNYAQSWDAAAKHFQRATTKAGWIERLQSARKPQGQVVSRQLRTTWRFGSRFTVKFDTAFAGLKAAVETVTFSRESDGQWRAIGYLILPAYAEESFLRSPAQIPLFIASMSGVLGLVAFCLFPNPPQLLVWSILGAALLGIILGIPGRRNWFGKSAIAVGSINATIWLTIFIVTSFRPDTSFYIGQTSFPKGDSIVITSVRRTKDEIAVKGHYNLVSADNAHLDLYITTSSTNLVPTDTKQLMRIARGQGDFELIHPNPVPGLPHVTMYSPDGKPFAGVYFGNKTEALEEGKLDLGYYQSSNESSVADDGPTLAELPPVVVETWPASGARGIEPGITEIHARFSKEMADNSWSWSPAWEHSLPEMIGTPKYDADRRTCMITVRLEPGQTYATWLNSEEFHNFTDKHGRSAIPYLLIFQTKGNHN